MCNRSVLGPPGQLYNDGALGLLLVKDFSWCFLIFAAVLDVFPQYGARVAPATLSLFDVREPGVLSEFNQSPAV